MKKKKSFELTEDQKQHLREEKKENILLAINISAVTFCVALNFFLGFLLATAAYEGNLLNPLLNVLVLVQSGNMFIWSLFLGDMILDRKRR